MMYIKMIMEQLNVSEEAARKIFDEICCMDVNLSNSSKAKLKRVINEAAASLKERGTI